MSAAATKGALRSASTESVKTPCSRIEAASSRRFSKKDGLARAR